MPMRMESSSASLGAAAAWDRRSGLGRRSDAGSRSGLGWHSSRGWSGGSGRRGGWGWRSRLGWRRGRGWCSSRGWRHGRGWRLGSGRSRRPTGTGGLRAQGCEQCRSARGSTRSEPRGEPLRLLFEELLQGREHLEVRLPQLHDGAAVLLERVEHLPGLPALRPRFVAQNEQPPPLPRELEPGRRHGSPQPVQCRHRVVVQHGSKRPVHFIVGVRIDYAPQPGMQRGVPPGQRIHREGARRGVLLRPRRQAGAQQRGQTSVHLLLVENTGDVHLPNQLVEPPVEFGSGRRRGWLRGLTPPAPVRRRLRTRGLGRELLQLGNTTALPTVRAVVLHQVDQTARREQGRVGEGGRRHRPGRIRGREPGAGEGRPEVRGHQRLPDLRRRDLAKLDDRRISSVRGWQSPVTDQRPSVVQARQDDEGVLHVLREIHESDRHCMGQRLLLGAVERPSQRDQPVELIDRHQSRTPRGARESVERADDLPARNPACADGMRARLVALDFLPLQQRVSEVTVTKILAVGQDERQRHVQGNLVPGPPTEMTLQASADDLQVPEIERPRHQVVDLCSFQPNRFAQTMKDGT